MKLLLDSCVWRGARRDLESQGHDVSAAFDWEKDPGDEEILGIAYEEGRILITLDKDFGELAIIHGRPHSGILRLVDIPAKLQGPLSMQILKVHGEELRLGAIVTAEPGRLRVRPPETL